MHFIFWDMSFIHCCHGFLQLFQSDRLDNCRLHSFKLPNPPVASAYATAVIIGHRVYVGGGVSEDVGWAHIIHVYDMSTGKWEELPPAPQYCFELVFLNGSLVLLGGVESATGKTTGMVSVWQINEAQWTQAIPPMKVSRWRPGVLVLRNSLYVCGGTSEYKGRILNSCEVLDLSTNQWKIVSLTLPEPLYGLKLGVFGNNVLLTSGWSTISRPTDKSWSIQCDSFLSTSNMTSQWTCIANTPYYGSSLLLNSKQPVLIGGFRARELTRGIYLYKSEQWECVGELVVSSPLMRPAVTAVGSNSFLVIGGHTNPYNYKVSLLNNVELITFC